MTSSISNPTISVVLPNYNHGHCIGRALESVCTQDLQPLEILVLEDCSTDNSMEVIQDYADRYPFVKVIRYLEKSTNWLEAWCAHVQVLRGDYVLGLAADDLVFPGLFRAATNVLKKHPGAGVVFSDVNLLDPQGQIIGRYSSGVVRDDLLQGEAIQRQVSRQWESLPNQLVKPDLFETGAGSVIRRDALIWLNSFRLHELGPWYDAIGYVVVALKHGAVYLADPYGGFTASVGQYSSSIFEESKSVENYRRVSRFLRDPALQAFAPPAVIEALLQKVIARLSPEALKSLSLSAKVTGPGPLAQSSQLEYADQTYRRLAAQSPERAEVFADWGGVLLLMNRFQDAEAALLRSLSLKPRQTHVHTHLGICLQVRGKLQEARAAYMRAIELDPNNVEAHLHYGETLERLGPYPQAAEAYRRVSELKPELAAAREKRDMCLTRLR